MLEAVQEIVFLDCLVFVVSMIPDSNYGDKKWTQLL